MRKKQKKLIKEKMNLKMNKIKKSQNTKENLSLKIILENLTYNKKLNIIKNLSHN